MCNFGEQFCGHFSLHFFFLTSSPNHNLLFSNFGIFNFCSKTLLKAVDDNEMSSAIGSAVVLKNFIKLRGAELFHAVPELVHDSLAVSSSRFSKI